MDKNYILITATSFFKAIYTIMYGFHSRITSRENPSQFRYIKLVRITLKNRLPAFKTNHSYLLNIRMTLETSHSMDDDWRTVYMHELFGNILTHTVT